MPSELEAVLEAEGWEYSYTEGSHYYFTKSGHEYPVGVPHHGQRRIEQPLLGNLLRLAGIDRQTYLRRMGKNPLTRNPVERHSDGFYARLPRRYSLRGGAVWWFGPFPSENAALVAAGLVRGANAVAVAGERGWYMRASGGLRLAGAPAIGPFSTQKAAAALLGRLLAAGETPELRTIPAPATVKTARTATMAAASTGRQQLPENFRNAFEALVRLGYDRSDARNAVQTARERLPADSDETAILQAIMRPASNPTEDAPCLSCGCVLIVPVRHTIIECPACSAVMEVTP